MNRDKFDSEMPLLLTAARKLPAGVTDVTVHIIRDDVSYLSLFRGQPGVPTETLERRLNSTLSERLQIVQEQI